MDINTKEDIMRYRIDAFRGKVNSVIELSDDMVPVGAVYIGEDLFIIVLDPLDERTLPEEEATKGETEEEKLAGGAPPAEETSTEEKPSDD